MTISKYKECLELLKTNEDTNSQALILHNLGETYLYQKDMDNAQKYIAEAIKVSNMNGHDYIQARAMDCLAGIHFNNGDLEKALDCEIKAAEISIRNSDLSLHCNIQINISSIYQAIHEDQKALNVLEKIHDKLTNINDSDMLMKYYHTKSELLEKLENYKEAFECKNLFIDVFYEHYNKEKLKLIEEKQKNTNILMAEIINLKQEKDLAELQNKKELLDKELTYKALQIVQKNELISNIMSSLENLQTKNPKNVKIIQEILESISIDTASQNVWNEFEKWFTEVHKDFFKKLSIIAPKLTNRYYQLAAFLKLGLRSKEIALLMGISTESVEKYRIRFRKKLNLAAGEKLQNFIGNL